MRVLYVNHTSKISGGEHSLLDLLAGLPGTVSPILACPPGPLAEAVHRRGLEWHVLPAIDASLRLHPVHTTTGVAKLLAAGAAVRRLAARLNAHLLHANSVRAGLVTSVAAPFGMPPAILHIRDCLPPGLVSTLVLRSAARGASMILANSEYTGRSAQRIIGDQRTPIRVAHSPIDLDRFDPNRFDRLDARTRLGLDVEVPVLAVVGQMTPWKGQDDAIRIVELVKRRHPHIRLLLVGEATFANQAGRYDNESYVRRLYELIEARGVRREVMMLGQRSDVAEILRAVDLLLVPSWEEPFGRVVGEGMAMGVPVIATKVGGPAEILRGNTDGLLLAPRDPQHWAAEVVALLDDPQRRSAMGARAMKRARMRFSLSAHVDAVLATYRRALDGS